MPARRRPEPPRFDETDLRDLLAYAVAVAGGPGRYCKAHGLHYEQMRLFLTGKRPPEPKILAALGMERVCLYRPTAGDKTR